MKMTLLYTKDTAREVRAIAEFGEGMPTLQDLKEHYVKVYYSNDFQRATPNDVFRIFNGNDDREPNPLSTPNGQVVVHKLDTHTSMSVGDMVQLGSMLYICQPVGFAKVKFNRIYVPHYYPLGMPEQDFDGSRISAPNCTEALRIARQRAVKLDLVAISVKWDDNDRTRAWRFSLGR